MNLEKIEQILSDEPAYRKAQINKLIFGNLIESWAEASTLSLALRKKLEKEAPLSINHEKFVSKENKTTKVLINLTDGSVVEAVLMQHKDNRNTVCVSSQVGCPIGCVFCATGGLGFKRNLETEEILDQVLLFARMLKKTGGKVTNIVFMGMGEPFLNYNSVLKAINILHDEKGFNLGARHFSISTIGIIDGIKKLAQEKLPINLAVSLHAPNDDLRRKIIPSNNKYSTKKLLKAVDDYIAKTNRKVMIEYVLIKGVNDSLELAKELAELLKGKLCFVNLIAYNKTDLYQPALPERRKEFQAILEKQGITTTQRYRFGHDISAACGQLAGKRN